MKFRNIIFWCHLISGVVAGLIILIMSVTGTILAFEKQIVAFAERDVRWVDQATDSSVPLSVESLIDHLKEFRPEKKPDSIIYHNNPQRSVEVSFGRDDTVYVDPYTGNILGGESRVHEWMHTITSWHRWLGSRERGRPVTGVCNLLFLFLSISGFYLWWPRQWQFKAIKPILFFNGKLRGKPRDWNWHNVIGFWLAPFLIIITLTGGVMSYNWMNDLLYRAAGSEPPPPRQARGGSGQVDGKDMPEKHVAVDLDNILLQAKQKTDAWRFIRLRLPKSQAKMMDVNIQENDPFYPSPRSTLTFDTETVRQVKWESYKEQSRGRKWRTWARYLHTGEAGGIVGQIIGFFACMGACFLVWTGLAMSWQRFSVWNKNNKLKKGRKNV